MLRHGLVFFYDKGVVFVSDSELITISGPSGIITKKCCIIPNRHIHVNHEERVKYGLDNIEKVSVKIGGLKSAILENVFIKESENGVFEMHVDTDDANGCLLNTGDDVEIIF